MSTLKTKLWALGITADELDSIVDDGASRLASRVNNEGMSEQLRFLEEQAGMSESDILSALQESESDILSALQESESDILAAVKD